MRTFTRNSRLNTAVRQHGFTLVELLITLSVLSLGALVAAGGMNLALPQRAVDYAAEQLVSDLKRARLEAQKSGVPVTVSIESDHYAAESLFSRYLNNGVTIALDVNRSEIVFDRSFAHLGGAILIKKGTRQAVVKVHPITGKIARVE